MCPDITPLTAIASASSIHDLITTIPAPYRPALGRYIVKRYRQTHDRARAARTLSSLQRHLRRGTFPMSIRDALKVPILSIHDNFTRTPECAAAVFALHAGVHAARQPALRAVIVQVAAELAFLSSQTDLHTAEWEHDWARFVTDTAAGMVQAYGCSLNRDADGGCHLVGMSAEAEAGFSAILGASALYATRLLQLAQANAGHFAR